MYDGDIHHTVTLIDGSILFRIYDNDGRMTASRTMKPYEQCRFDLGTGKMCVDVLDEIDRYQSWTDGILRFRDKRMEDITGRLEQYYGVKIRIKDEALKNVLYTGSFSLEQPIADVLNTLNYDNKFTIKTEGMNFVLNKK